MAIYKVSPDTCIFVNPKAGSMSMRAALNAVPHSEISPIEALALDRRVVFIRHPIERLNSLFNMFYWLSLNNTTYSEFMPAGTIRAYGRRVAGGKGANEHHWKEQKISKMLERLATKRGEGEISDEDLTRWLDNKDYKSFVNYILEGNNDDHWANQVDLCTNDGVFIPNIAHRFDADVGIHWAKYVGGTFPHINSWQKIEHGEYKLDALKTYYAKDIRFWREINGTWNADA